MSDNEQAVDKHSEGDSFVDAVSAVFIVVIPVIAIVYWLSGM
ncbi:MAG: hypothetical protein VB957_10100 [Pseudomonadales bacterium]|jgi:hypothetical protein